MDNYFTIEVEGLSYQVQALEDETFLIMKHGVLFCRIFPEIGIDTEIKWGSGDLVSQDLIDKIGYAIEMHEM